MKTIQTMHISLLSSDVRAETKTLMICANDLISAHNRTLRDNEPYRELRHYFASKFHTDYVGLAAQEWGLAEESLVEVRGKGLKSTTWVHMSVAINAAMWISPEARVQVIKAFITDRILQWRDESGDNFIALNEHIDNYMGGREGKTSNHGVYINAAKKLKLKILGDDSKEMSWNGATAEQLRHRTLLEQKLCTALELGAIDSMEALYKAIDRFK